MSYRNQAFAEQILTDDGQVILNPADQIFDFEGSIIFGATGVKASGTFSASAQLQGSNDAFATKKDLGSPVVMVDTVTAEMPLSGTILYYVNYRVVITGTGTQSTAITGTYTKKSRG